MEISPNDTNTTYSIASQVDGKLIYSLSFLNNTNFSR